MTAADTSPVAPGRTPRAARNPHAMPEPDLELAGHLMVFNWLLAAYAHADWLGPWAELLAPRDAAGMRLLRRASLALLARHDLQERFLQAADIEAHPWLLMSPQQIQPVAQELGVAMLGGWVRTRLEREQVAQQRQVLNAEQRATAMRHAAALRGLPYANEAGWPLSRLEPDAVAELGVSCMAALLDNPRSGARERFTMQFARGMVVPLALSNLQRQEATNLIASQLETAGAPPALAPSAAPSPSAPTRQEAPA